MSRVREILEAQGFEVEEQDGRIRAAKDLKPSSLPGEAARVKRKIEPLVSKCRVAGRFVVGDEWGELTVRAVV